MQHASLSETSTVLLDPYLRCLILSGISLRIQEREKEDSESITKGAYV